MRDSPRSARPRALFGSAFCVASRRTAHAAQHDADPRGDRVITETHVTLTAIGAVYAAVTVYGWWLLRRPG